MTLLSFGPLYIGLDDWTYTECFTYPSHWSIHLGRLRLELEKPAVGSRGSTQAPTNQPTHLQGPQGL